MKVAILTETYTNLR